MTKLAGRSVGLQGRAYGDVFFLGEGGTIYRYTHIYIYVYIYCLLTCLAAVCSYAVRSLFFASGVCRRGGVSIYIYMHIYIYIHIQIYIYICISEHRFRYRLMFLKASANSESGCFSGTFLGGLDVLTTWNCFAAAYPLKPGLCLNAKSKEICL